MRRFLATLLLFIAISPSTADDCSQNVGASCQGKEGMILCCSEDGNSGFVYCQWDQSTYALTPCLSQYPNCEPNDDGYLNCENNAELGIDVTRVSNTGDVIDRENDVIWNIVTGKGFNSNPYNKL
jgi:hypothetical protein